MRRAGSSMRTELWRLPVGLLFVVLAAGGDPTLYAGETCDLVSQLAADDGEESDEFGFSVAIDGDIAVVGARENTDGNEEEAGAAYVFRFDGSEWTQDKKLIASDGMANDHFGGAVAVSGDTVVVGAPNADEDGNDCGAAYVFVFGSGAWVEQQKLHASDASDFDQFGSAVAVLDDTVVVGVERNDENGNDAGAAYVYRRDDSSWVEEQKLVAGDTGDQVGFSVALFDSTIVLGAPGDLMNGGQAGAAHVYRLEGSEWVLEQTLRASDGSDNHRFGQAVSIYGDAVLVGAYGDESSYIFRFDRELWVQEQKLVPSDDDGPGGVDSVFGITTGLSGDIAVIGAYAAQDAQDNLGAAYIYRYNGTTWVEEDRLIDPDGGGENNLFAYTVAASGDRVIVGAYLDESAFVFRGVPTGDCNGNAIPDPCDIFKGLSDDCNDNGTPDECELVPSFFAASGHLSPFDAGSSQSFIIDSAPPAASIVTLNFTTSADLNHSAEWVMIDINGVPLGNLFVEGAAECPAIPDSAQILVADEIFNDAVGGGDAVITMIATSGVDQECEPASYIALTVAYEPADENADCNDNGTPDDCDVASGTSADCNSNSMPDECDIASGSSSDCDGNGIPDECDPDCNSNGFPDDCDIAGGTSMDCNNNGHPDECDIESGESEDCNTNGVPDSCDIADGTSSDSNENGIPDECDPCEGDVNGDGMVDPLDSGFVLARFGCSYPEDGENCLAADVNGDGLVDPLDVGFVLARFGPCP
ncbi:MAG: hypothetical protein IH988_00690 [Planctomycetes bacterium]|nr:hypothetical protein [Planctomycetota bacterium]